MEAIVWFVFHISVWSIQVQAATLVWWMRLSDALKANWCSKVHVLPEDICAVITRIVPCLKIKGILLVTGVINSEQVVLLDAKCTRKNADRMKCVEVNKSLELWRKLLCAILGTENSINHLQFFFFSITSQVQTKTVGVIFCNSLIFSPPFLLPEHN